MGGGDGLSDHARAPGVQGTVLALSYIKQDSCPLTENQRHTNYYQQKRFYTAVK